MKAIFAVILPLALALSGCLADFPYAWDSYGDPGWGIYGGGQEVENACMDRARETHHRVDGVRSVERAGRDTYRVQLDVRGVREPLICYYDARSGNVDLQWRTAYR